MPILRHSLSFFVFLYITNALYINDTYIQSPRVITSPNVNVTGEAISCNTYGCDISDYLFSIDEKIVWIPSFGGCSMEQKIEVAENNHAIGIIFKEYNSDDGEVGHLTLQPFINPGVMIVMVRSEAGTNYFNHLKTEITNVTINGDDYNPWVEVSRSWIPRFFMIVLTLYCIIIIVICTVLFSRFHSSSESGRVTVSMYVFLIIILANICRILYLIDLNMISGIFFYEYSVILRGIDTTFTLSAILLIGFYWMEVSKFKGFRDGQQILGKIKLVFIITAMLLFVSRIINSILVLFFMDGIINIFTHIFTETLVPFAVATFYMVVGIRLIKMLIKMGSYARRRRKSGLAYRVSMLMILLSVTLYVTCFLSLFAGGFGMYKYPWPNYILGMSSAVLSMILETIVVSYFIIKKKKTKPRSSRSSLRVKDTISKNPSYTR